MKKWQDKKAILGINNTRHSDDFKNKVVEAFKISGNSYRKFAAEVGISGQVLHLWVNERKKVKGKIKRSSMLSCLLERVKLLEKDIETLKSIIIDRSMVEVDDD